MPAMKEAMRIAITSYEATRVAFTRLQPAQKDASSEAA